MPTAFSPAETASGGADTQRYTAFDSLTNAGSTEPVGAGGTAARPRIIIETEAHRLELSWVDLLLLTTVAAVSMKTIVAVAEVVN